MIPEAAVESLARVLAEEALFDADCSGSGWNSETDSSDHFMPRARKRATEYLEAAAPHMNSELKDGMTMTENEAPIVTIPRKQLEGWPTTPPLTGADWRNFAESLPASEFATTLLFVADGIDRADGTGWYARETAK